MTHRNWCVVVLLLATALLAYPAITGAFLVNPESAQYLAGYAFRDFAAQSLRAGHGFPQWNSAMFGGIPFVAAQHGDIFYPTFLLRMVLRTDVASTWAVIAHVFLAGLFSFAFLRALIVSRYAALFGALAYMFSGPVASVAASGADGRLFVGTLLPLALLMLLRAIRDARVWGWGVFALVVGLAALSGDTAMLQCLVLTSFVFSVLLVLQAADAETQATRHDQIGAVLAHASATAELNTEQRLSRAIAVNHSRYIATRLLAVSGVILVGLLIGAVQSWPALAYAGVSAAASTPTTAPAVDAVRNASLPPEELLNVYLPQFSGILQRYWGRSPNHLQTVYLGVVVLIFATLGLGNRNRGVFARFWPGAAMLAFAWAVAAYTPFFPDGEGQTPALALLRAPGSMMTLVALSTAVLGALGLERAITRDLSARALAWWIAGWGTFGALVLLLTTTGALHAIARFITADNALFHRNGAAYISRLIENNERAQLLGALRSGGVVIAVALAILLFHVRRIPATAFATIMLALSTVDLWSIAHRYWFFSKPASQLYENDAILSYLRKQSQPGRVLVFTKSADYRTETDPYFGASGFGDGGGLMVHGIRSVSGYHLGPPARYARLLNDSTSRDPRFWQHENVRWLYTNAEVLDSTFTNVVSTTINSAGSRAFLYQMPRTNSYAWVASSFGTRGDSAALKEILRSSYNPHTFVSVDSATELHGQPVAPAPALFFPPTTITTIVSDFGPGRATVRLSAPATSGNALVISENFYRGWRAFADGTELPVMRTAFNLVGVALPAGTRVVSFSFQDPRYSTGRFITLLALVFTGALILFGWRRHRQTPVPSVDVYRMTRDGAV